MAVSFKELNASLGSTLQKLGVFETVGGELTHMPGRGLRAAHWFQRGRAVGEASGLGAASVRVDAMVRMFGSVTTLPRDEIDEELYEALDVLGAAYASDFTLGGRVRNIDIFGAHGQEMGWEAAYLDVQDGTCRVVTVTLPVIVNDVWNLEA